RNATVFVSRENLDVDPDNQTGKTRAGFILSAARDLMVEHAPMRPDLADSQVPTDEITHDDIALNSLCEFDIAYCIIVAAWAPTTALRTRRRRRSTKTARSQ
ncbi:hypothetical protein GS584_21760, partial [Rhodococcus hoagii]|nr:hypothetical protein [Prescottella equi]